MESNVLVSVIVPVYNVEKYLSECLDSICGQTYRNLEILLIDDGSTDHSGEICDQYAKTDKRIRVFHQNNSGAAVAKNRGLDEAKGEFIQFVDADDRLDLQAIAIAMIQQQKNNADVIVFGFKKMFTDHMERNDLSIPDGGMNNETYLSCFPIDWTCSLFWNKLFRYTTVSHVRFRTERRCIDDEFFTYRIFFQAKKVSVITYSLYFYRQRKSSVTKSETYDKQRSQDAIDCMEQRYVDIRTKCPHIERGFLDHQFKMLVFMTYHYYINSSLISQIKKQLSQKIFRAVYHRINKGEILAAFRIILTPASVLIKKNDYNSVSDTDVKATDQLFD